MRRKMRRACCCYCHPLEQYVCRGLLQPKRFCESFRVSRCAPSWCGSLCCRRIGRRHQHRRSQGSPIPAQFNSGTGIGWSRIRWASMIATASCGITSLYTQWAPFGRRVHQQRFITGILWLRWQRPLARRSLRLCWESRPSCLTTSKDEDRMDVKTAIQNGDASPLRELLKEDWSRANELIRWGGLGESCLTHPLHFISDMLFKGTLAKGKEIVLADALI